MPALTSRLRRAWKIKTVHTIACLSMMLCIETCTLLYHIMAANWPANRQSNWQANRPAKCYVLVCTCMYWHVLSCTVSWYVQVCTSMNQYVLVCTGLYSTLLRLLSVSTQGFMVSTAKLPGCLLLQRCWPCKQGVHTPEHLIHTSASSTCTYQYIPAHTSTC